MQNGHELVLVVKSDRGSSVSRGALDAMEVKYRKIYAVSDEGVRLGFTGRGRRLPMSLLAVLDSQGGIVGEMPGPLVDGAKVREFIANPSIMATARRQSVARDHRVLELD
jgi:hypothetical protein